MTGLQNQESLFKEGTMEVDLRICNDLNLRWKRTSRDGTTLVNDH